MLWNRLVLGFMLVTFAVSYAQEARCPSYHGSTPLYGAKLYDGPPDQLADLEPDSWQGSGNNGHGYYDVGAIFDAGRNLYIVCIYGEWNSKDKVTVKIDKKVNRCNLRASPKGKPASLTCK